MTGFSAETVLAGLKDFQRETVEYVFGRMYLDPTPTRRFLVADEVGLGKTLVAKGVIAKVLEHLEGTGKRIDIVYVCSNTAIAHQNVNRLNVLGKGTFALASRLTLLPTQVQNLRANKVNFVSFTPGTTFDLKSRSGTMHERSVLFRMLAKESWIDEPGLLHLLQGPAGPESWKHCAYGWAYPVDEAIAEAFRTSVREDAAFRALLADLCARFHRHRSSVPGRDGEDQYAITGLLRQRLAQICLVALKPDLIILDEFQRFRNLLRADDTTAELAQALFNYPDARVLLLSATPYKMLSLDHEAEDDHYPDFLQTLGFLFDRPAAVDQAKAEIQAFRSALLDLDLARPEVVLQARDALQHRLGAVMCRTERVGLTDRQDAMVSEPRRPAPLQAADLHHAALLDGVSREVRARDSIEYWKSAPHALSFMKGYELRRNLDKLAGEALAAATGVVHQHRAHLLTAAPFQAYKYVEPANPRLRSLCADTLDEGLWRVLWLPPSMPSWQPTGAFAEVGEATKALVFSAWNVVPDAIAALCSYEAERLMVEGLNREGLTHAKLPEKVRPLLKFSRGEDLRLSGMPTLLLLYPSPSLASLADPVALALEVGVTSAPSLADVLHIVRQRVQAALARIVADAPTEGREDERWYWAAPAMLDRAAWPGVDTWRKGQWGTAGDAEESDPGASFREHVDLLGLAFAGQLVPQLGRVPADLHRVLADLALAGPAVCALRSLRRAAPELGWDAGDLLSAAAQVGSGFRTLFNVPESIALLRGGDVADYWRITLTHGLEGNLPALLDEQVHVLRESLGLTAAASAARVKGIAKELADSLSIRTSQITADELTPRPKAGRIDFSEIKLRCRFALRFGELRDDKSQARVETVRSAFNSPFRPFILASTSVGQEGLDFHTWCHAIVHWNLPSNPVDLEQREGRVHRYKGHAVRKNVAKALGHDALRGRWQPGDDPWAVHFTAAREQRSCDLLTYWLFEVEGGAQIERRVPLLPLSRDVAQLARLKRGLALYRLVFGQPRQEDLLAHLSERLAPEDVDRVVKEWRIDLRPRASGPDRASLTPARPLGKAGM